MPTVSAWFAAALAFGLPFVAFARLILVHFYVRGSFLLDSGLLAFLMWRSDARLTMPESLGGESFFAFHVTPVFLLLAALSRVLPLTMPQFFAGFLGLGHGLLALAVQHLCFPGQSSFMRVYLGDPPLQHLSAALLATRLLFLLHYRAYVVLPAIGSVAWAAWARSPSPLVGFAACLPWTILHVLAASPLAGVMAGYYAFPFLLALAWPLLGALIERRGAAPTGASRLAVGGFFALLALGSLPTAWGAYNPGRLTLTDVILRAPSLARQADTDAAIAALAAARASLGRLVVGNSIAALRPAAFARQEVAGGVNDAAPDTVVFFDHGFDADRLRAAAARAGLNQMYRVPRTSIVIMTRQPPTSAAPAP